MILNLFIKKNLINWRGSFFCTGFFLLRTTVIALHPVFVDTSSFPKICKHSGSPKLAVSISESNYSHSIFLGYSKLLYFDSKIDTVGFRKPECFRILRNRMNQQKQDIGLLIFYINIIVIWIKQLILLR